MTIGAAPGDYSCFDTLANCRQTVADSLGVDAESLELSMDKFVFVFSHSFDGET